MVRLHLVESGYCKTLGSLKGAPILHHFLHEKILHQKTISKIMKLAKKFWGKGQSDAQENGLMQPYFTPFAANRKFSQM